LSDLLVIEFPSEEKAEGVREMLLAMQREYLIELGDAVVAVKGAIPGLLWGSLIGLPFMMPLAGAAIGAASSAGGSPTSASTTTLWSRRRERCNPAMPRCSF
jgi:uncharacterized membrane protein